MIFNSKFDVEDKVWFVDWGGLSKCNISGCHSPDHKTSPRVSSGEIHSVRIHCEYWLTKVVYDIAVEGSFDEIEVFKTKREAQKYFNRMKDEL